MSPSVKKASKKAPRAKKPAVEWSALQSALCFDAESGRFFYRATNQMADRPHSQGYLTVSIASHTYLSHRLVWFYVNRHWPNWHIDHINGVRTDNRLENLREATNAQNMQNARAHCDGAGLLGTSWEKKRGKWQAGIGVNGKRIHLGYFATREEAHSAYLSAKKEFHPFGGSRA